MKLTKSQRLFIKIGEALAKEKIQRQIYELDCKLGVSSCEVMEKNAKAIAVTKRKRKKLIREAVFEAQVELDEAYHKGWRDGFWDE